MTGALRE